MGVHPTVPVAEPPSITVPDGPVERMNLRTRTEAKQQWCAFARAVRGDGVSGLNRGTDLLPDVACMCIADLCAHWRFRSAGGTRYELASFEATERVGPEGVVPVPDGWYFERWDGKTGLRYWARKPVEIVLPKGCCGLGGEP